MENEEIELIATTDEYETTQICILLEKNEIPYIRRDNGSGSYMNLYFGQSIQIKRIFVRKEDYDKASVLISAFSFNLSETLDEKENVQELEDENKQLKQEEIEEQEGKKYQSIRKWFGILSIIVPIIILIVILITQI